MEKKLITTKQDFLELVNKYLDSSLEQLAKSKSYLATLINIDNADIGNVSVKTKYQHNQQYEVAAWYSVYDIKEGTYPAKARVKDSNVSVSFYPTAKLTEEFTPTLYGGVPVTSGKREVSEKDTTILQHFHSSNHSIDITNQIFKLAEVTHKLGNEFKVTINYDHPEIIQKINNNRKFYERNLSTDLNQSIIHFIKNDANVSLLRGIGDYKEIEGQKLYEIVQEVTKPHLQKLHKLFNNNIDHFIKENSNTIEIENKQKFKKEALKK